MSELKNSNSEIRLNLEQQKKQAKELLRQFKACQVSAFKRFEQYHPQGKKLDADSPTFEPKLSDAQLVIARENGLSSWAKFKVHIEQLNQARQAIALKISPPDADCKTLHLRCGCDIQQGLKQAGFLGDFLEFADPYCQGTLPDDSNFSHFLSQRANFISQAYGIELKDAHKRLEREYDRLHKSHHYPRIVLWFEHDVYDQLILAYILHHFWHSGSQPEQLELICLDKFPGIHRFLGLGQLSPEALRTLWYQRQPMTPKRLELGHRVWQGLTASSPQALNCIINQGLPELPFMAQALHRHLQELPWIEDGLSLTERLTLTLLLEKGAMTGGQLFKTLTLEKEPLPYLGDTMYWQVLATLSHLLYPPFDIDIDTIHLPWSRRILQLNDTGHALLNRQVHGLQLNPINRWVGGVPLCSHQPLWLWDEERGQPIPRRLV
ncbi:MAG: DUF1835 domain-containing protein [Coleofasciculus sp. G1-WW12-02]|uniref:DUF1835 domain-containing protein n=1 Tax=Coleofasciculus sp. G1-WW12-02 TaxID=3068483 RepID=UPI003303F563